MDCGMADMRNETSLSCPETAWNSPSVFSAPSTRDAFACCWTLNQLHYIGYQRKKVCMRGDTIDDFYSLSNLSKKLFEKNVDSFQTVDPYIRRRLVKDHLHSIRQFGVFLKMRMKSVQNYRMNGPCYHCFMQKKSERSPSAYSTDLSLTYKILLIAT